MKKEEVKIGHVGPEQIAEWKKKYPEGIYSIISQGHVGYFKNPSFDDCNYALSRNDYDKPLDAYHAFGEVTFIGGSEEIIKNPGKHRGAISSWREKLNGEQAELVNL